MQLIASGVILTDTPDEHLLFSNVLIGLLLKLIYATVPNVSWYAIYQIATLAIAATAACYALLRVNATIRQTGVIALFLVTAYLPCLVELQFTKTAFLALLRRPNSRVLQHPFAEHPLGPGESTSSAAAFDSLGRGDPVRFRLAPWRP